MCNLIHNFTGSGYGFAVGDMGCRAMFQAALMVLLARSLGHDAWSANVAIISVSGFFRHWSARLSQQCIYEISLSLPSMVSQPAHSSR